MQKTNKPQQQEKHPAEWQRDLNPDPLAGQNIGEPERLRRAADLKSLRRQLQGFTDDQLAQIPIVATGQRLQQGAVYLDLRGTSREPFTATGDMTATDGHLYVAKAGTPYETWNRLLAAIRSGEAKAGGDTALPEGTVDKTLEDSFPSSDPPAWTTGREPVDPNLPQAPREKRVEPDD